jgi:hypothetical protein
MLWLSPLIYELLLVQECLLSLHCITVLARHHLVHVLFLYTVPLAWMTGSDAC